MRKFLVAAVLAAFVGGTFAAADEQFFGLQEAFAYKRFKKLDPSISYAFGSQDDNASVVRSLRAHQKAKGAAKDAQKACQEALFKTLIRFQKTAKKMGLNKVVNLRGYYNKKEFDSKDKFQCWIVEGIAHVYLLGDVAQ